MRLVGSSVSGSIEEVGTEGLAGHSAGSFGGSGVVVLGWREVLARNLV